MRQYKKGTILIKGYTQIYMAKTTGQLVREANDEANSKGKFWDEKTDNRTQVIFFRNDPEYPTRQDEKIEAEVYFLPTYKKENTKVLLNDSITEYRRQNLNYKLPIMLGMSTDGTQKYADLVDLKQVLTVGQTGSGKSMFQDSLIYTLTTLVPENVQLFLVDMKRVSLSIYRGIPQLMVDVIERQEEYYSQIDLLIKEKNRRIKLSKKENIPYIVAIIDTISDLVYFDQTRFESQLSDLLDNAETAKIHLLISDSRINSTIFSPKLMSLFPTKICFATTTVVDSQYIIGSEAGAKLNGRGDALLKNNDGQFVRLQTPFVSDEELNVLIEELKNSNK